MPFILDTHDGVSLAAVYQDRIGLGKGEVVIVEGFEPLTGKPILGRGVGELVKLRRGDVVEGTPVWHIAGFPGSGTIMSREIEHLVLNITDEYDRKTGIETFDLVKVRFDSDDPDHIRNVDMPNLRTWHVTSEYRAKYKTCGSCHRTINADSAVCEACGQSPELEQGDEQTG